MNGFYASNLSIWVKNTPIKLIVTIAGKAQTKKVNNASIGPPT